MAPQKTTIKERQALVLESQKLVTKLVQNAMHRHGLPEDCREELSAAGNLGLVQAAASFDPDLGVKFASFAGHRVHGEIIDSLRRSKTSLEVPQESLDGEMSPSPSPEERAMAKEEVKRLHETMLSLGVRERALIETHYGQGPSLSEVASRQGISTAWASRLRERAVETIRDTYDLADELEQDEEQERSR